MPNKPNKLIKMLSSGNKEGEGGKLASIQLTGTSGWNKIALIFIGLALLGGCGGSSGQILTAQAVSEMQARDSKKELLQQQLLLQGAKASLANYRDYKVGPEDQLEIVIFGQDKLNRMARVNGQGELTMPLVGVVKVAGLTPSGIEQRLAELYDAHYLVNPQITVTVKEYRHQRVAVTGAVDKPGSYEIIGPRTLLEVLSLAGGFSNKAGAPSGDVVNVIRSQNASDLTKTAKTGVVQPFSSKTETMVIDVRRLLSGQAPDLNVTVRNGDVIHVPFAGTAYVLGGVKKPGNIAVRENLTISQAVALAGGIEPILGTNNITIMRFDEQGKPISIDTNLKRIITRTDPDLSVKDNDVVVVRESELKKAVYIIRTLLPIPSGSYSMGAAGF